MLEDTNVAARVKLLVMYKRGHWGGYAALIESYRALGVLRGLALKGNVAEKCFRGTLLLQQQLQQGNTATIWDTWALSQFSTVPQRKTHIISRHSLLSVVLL